jgi:hypothetical protein
VIDSQAGAASDSPELNRKVVASKETGVARPNVTRIAKIAARIAIADSTTIRNRLESMMSASAPAGRTKRNIGKRAAT